MIVYDNNSIEDGNENESQTIPYLFKHRTW